MTLRDDMVFAPGIGEQHAPTARNRARIQRRASGARAKGIMRRLRLARRARRLKPLTRAKASGRKVTAMARRGASAMARGTASRLGARAMATPVGAAIGAVLVAAVTTLRIASGKPLEGTGEMVNRMVLGDMDEEARARMTTRHRFQDDADLTRIRAQTGADNSQLQRLSEDLYNINKRDEDGASLLREEFPTNNVIDMLILRGKEAFMKAWNGSGGPDHSSAFRKKYGELKAAHSSKGGGR